MIFLSWPMLMRVADRVVDGDVRIRDPGILEGALARTQTTVFGEDAYPTLETKAAALLQSIVQGHALIDGNKRLGLGAVIAFLGVNGRRLTLSEDEAYTLVIDVATGVIEDVSDIAARLRTESAAPGAQ